MHSLFIPQDPAPEFPASHPPQRPVRLREAWLCSPLQILLCKVVLTYSSVYICRVLKTEKQEELSPNTQPLCHEIACLHHRKKPESSQQTGSNPLDLKVTPITVFCLPTTTVCCKQVWGWALHARMQSPHKCLSLSLSL